MSGRLWGYLAVRPLSPPLHEDIDAFSGARAPLTGRKAEALAIRIAGAGEREQGRVCARQWVAAKGARTLYLPHSPIRCFASEHSSALESITNALCAKPEAGTSLQ